MIVHPDCQDYSITSLKQYTWEDDLYLTGACLPTAGRLVCMHGIQSPRKTKTQPSLTLLYPNRIALIVA